MRDTLPMFEKAYQQWGRKLDVEVVEMSGTDETANRADAVKVAAMKPFAVIDLIGDEVFLTSVAKEKILALGGLVSEQAEHRPGPVPLAAGPRRRRERAARRRVDHQGPQGEAGGIRR